MTGGSLNLGGKEIKLPALPFALPANAALNTLQQVYPSARPSPQTLPLASVLN